MDLASQKELLNRIRQGENQAVKELYKYAFDYCISFVLKSKGTKDDGKDVFQRVMLALIEKLKDPEFVVKGKIRSYLYGITRNQWLNDLKKGGRIIPIIGEEDQEITLTSDYEMKLSEKIEEESQFQRLNKAFDKASKTCQDVLKMFFFQGMRDKEIAPLLNLSENFVRNKRSRCIKGIKKELGIK